MGFRGIAGVLAGLAAAAGVPARAQTADELRAGIDVRRTELRGAESALKSSDEQRRLIESELEILRNDRARLANALIDTTARARTIEARIDAIEKRLETSLGSEEAIRRSLEARRGVVAEVLAALQRMGRKPPPAVLANPRDMLTAVRAAMLLGAIVPELRAETAALASDLGELVRIRAGIAREKDELARELDGLAGERRQLAALVDTRQKALAETELALRTERGRGQDLARQATDLKDLIGRMEGDASSAARADAARRAEEQRKAEEARKAADKPPEAPRARVAMGPFRDPARLAPAIPFAEARGLLPMPVAGTVVKAFGAPDGYGGVEKGISLAVRPGAAVTSPTDGWVAFSGPYRGYGQLLIINAGGGYYVVIAGMDRINVEVRQFVLAGEPVAVMGDGATKAAAALAIGATQPILYVEFRKDGASIDPGPWWARPEQEKVRG